LNIKQEKKTLLRAWAPFDVKKQGSHGSETGMVAHLTFIKFFTYSMKAGLTNSKSHHYFYFCSLLGEDTW
jgi:hypothetical protein